MLNNEQNINFTGRWANFKMRYALKSALKSREPQISGDICYDLFGHPRAGGISIKPHTPAREIQVTQRITEAVDKFTKAKPNEASFKIVGEIAKAFPPVKPGLISIVSGKKISTKHPNLKETLENLSRLRQELHSKLNTFIAEKKS